MNQRNIVLVGMMGSGKTTIAKLLKAKFKEFELRDIDSIITQLESRSINEIFETDGEGYFRDIENNVIKGFATGINQIISTGGGVCKNEINISNLKENGIIFYLSASSEELFNRIKNDTSRPLLKTDEVRKTIEILLAKRENNYKMADFEIETTNKTPEAIVEEIIEKYNKYE